MNSLTLILPTFNEEANILGILIELLKSVRGSNWNFEILVVDDNSDDNTAQIVNKFSLNNPMVKIVSRNGQRGLTPSLNQGIKHAQGKYIMWMDSDFSHPPEVLSKIILLLETGHDVVIGSRFLLGGGDLRNGKYLIQKILSRLLSFLGKKITKADFTDFSSGLIAINREVLLKIGNLRGIHGEYFIDLLCKLKGIKCSIIEIPYYDSNRRRGVSKTLDGILKKGIRYLLMIFKNQGLIGANK